MDRRTAVFTIVAKNYIPYARVLMHSVAKYHPDWQRFVILTDLVEGYFDPQAEDFEVVVSRDLGIPESRWMHFKYTILELSTAVKPYVFEHLLEQHAFDRIVYLDPDISLYSPMSEVERELEWADIVITPHLTRALADDRKPAELDIIRSGTYNLGFIAINGNGRTREFLTWWQEKLYDQCVVDLAQGIFVDQKWIDLVPGLFDRVAIIRHPGYNVAYWNLSHRQITSSEAGYQLDDVPLSFFHFSGYDATDPGRLSRHQNRFQVSDLPPATQELLHSYGQELIAAGYLTSRRWPYAYAAFSNGTLIPDLLRPIHHEVPELASMIDDPFSSSGFDAFVRVWNRPAHGDHAGHPGISQLAYRIYSARTDVQAVMPDIFGRDYKRFLDWMLISGPVEHGLSKEFLSTIVEAMASDEVAPESSKPNQEFDDSLLPAGEDSCLRLTRLAAEIYRSRPDLQRHFPDPCGRDSVRFLAWFLTYGKKQHNLTGQLLAPMKDQWRTVVRSQPGLSSQLRHECSLRKKVISIYTRDVLERMHSVIWSGKASPLTPEKSAARNTAESSEPREFGVNLIGYFHSATGMGQSARAAISALEAASVPISLRCIGSPVVGRKQDVFAGSMSVEFPYSTNLFHVNADQASIVKLSLGEQFYRNRHNVGYWAWELDQFPDHWKSAFLPYREIWTPSDFCVKAISAKANVPVFRVPHAIEPVVPTGMGRQHFSLSKDKFIFLVAFDVLSVVERKNPLAAIKAFLLAFGERSSCQLVIKVNNAGTSPECIEMLKAAGSSGAVRIITSALSREEMYSLTECADCIVSLHRAEGFGLFIAEAMYLGKPVIVTNYSGNVDFTLPDNSLLVDYKLVPVGPGCEPYEPNGLWADPDIQQASKHMINVSRSAELRSRLSVGGREFIRTSFSADAVGKLIRERLGSVRSIRERQPRVTAAVVGGRRLRAS